jgi:hypothetical protein
MEFGSAFNIFSFYEIGSLSYDTKKTGQVLHGTSTATKTLISSLDIECVEYVQEYAQYVVISHQVLSYYYLKRSLLEQVQSSLEQLVASNDIECDAIEDGYFAIDIKKTNFPILQHPENTGWSSPTTKLVTSVSSVLHGFIQNNTSYNSTTEPDTRTILQVTIAYTLFIVSHMLKTKSFIVGTFKRRNFKRFGVYVKEYPA